MLRRNAVTNNTLSKLVQTARAAKLTLEDLYAQPGRLEQRIADRYAALDRQIKAILTILEAES